MKVKFINDSSRNGPEYRAKQVDRFCMEFPKSFDLEAYFIQSATFPEVYNDNSRIFRRSLLIEKGITITKSIHDNDELDAFKCSKEVVIEFVEPLSESPMQKITKWMSKNKKKEFDIDLKLLDEIGVIVEQWVLIDCVIKSIKMSDLNYGNSGLSKSILTVMPSAFKLVKCGAPSSIV